jgi:hypothetical protein
MSQLDAIVASGVRPSNIMCVDGFRVSVIASASAYCTPRTAQGPYTHVEVGFPSRRPEPWDAWVKYAEDPEIPTGTVYGWVPVDLVRDLVAAHGGEA